MAYTEFDGTLDHEQPGYVEFNGELDKPDSKMDKIKSTISRGIDAGLSMLTPRKSIADQAQEQSASLAGTAAPQVSGVPIRRDYYNQTVAETPAGSSVPDTGIVSRVRNIAANDKQAQTGRRTVANALVSTEPAPEEGGFINSASRTVGQGIKGAGQVAADFIPGVEQNNAVKQFGQSVIDANPTAVNSLEDIAAKPGTAVAEATGNAAPSMAGMVGARAVGQGITALAPFTGPAAPLVAAAGQVVSWLGPAAIAALPSYGGIRDKQILNDPKNEKDAKAIAIATMGAAAVGAIEQAFGPQQWAMAALTKEGRAKLAEKFAAATLPGAVAKGVGKGALAEGSEELAQNPIEQLASFDNPTTKENIKDTLFGGAMGAIGGGVLGGGMPMIAGKPVTEHSDAALRYTAARGGERAKAAAKAELERRAVQGETNNTPESTPDAVERIIATGREKADETRATAPDALESNVLDEENTPETSPEAPQQAQPEGAGKPLSVLPEAPVAQNPQEGTATQGKANAQIAPGSVQPPADAAAAVPSGSVDAKPIEDAKAHQASASIPNTPFTLYRNTGHGPSISEALAARVENALNNAKDSYRIVNDRIKLPNGGEFIFSQDGKVRLLGDNKHGWGSTMSQSSINATLNEWLKLVDAKSAPVQADIFSQPVTKPEPKLETAPLPSPPAEGKSREAQPPAGTEGVPDTAQPVHPIRPLVESLIKRRAAARQGGKDLSNAIARGKEVMDGKRTDSKVENRWFRLQAKAFEKADPEAANILHKIGSTIHQKPDSKPPAEKNPGSWVIREKASGKVLMETFDKKKVDALNTEKYEAVPIQEYLAEINQKIKSGQEIPGTSSAVELITTSRKAKQNTAKKKKEQRTPTPAALDYDKIQKRPDTTERQLEAGRSVYEERLRSVVDRANGSLLGAALAKDFRERGGSELIGKTVKSAQDLAILAQIFRDPRFETFRIFFTKQGNIVHHTGITSRLPGAVNVVVGKKGESPDEASKRLYSDLAKQKKASGADGYYLLHNHPSGKAKPSSADEKLTRRMSGALPGLLSHVVIDTNEFAAIDKEGRSIVTKKELTGGYSGEASVPHDALKKNVDGPRALAEIGKLIERKEGFFSVIGLGSQLDVVAIADVPLSVISSKNNLRLHAMLRMFARNSGANSIAVVADNLEPFKKAITSGVIVDAVSTKDGKSARNLFRHPGDKLFGKNPKSIRVEQTPSQIDTPAFKKWFGNSKVVDKDGKPLVVYHGTNRDISSFAAGDKSAGQTNGNRTGVWGSYFTPDPKEASIYAELAGGLTAGGMQNIVPVYLSIRNPYVMSRLEWGRHSQKSAKAETRESGRAYAMSVRKKLESGGHDGIVIRDRGFNDEWVAFNPEQIKSAIGNNGNFDGNNPITVEQTPNQYLFQTFDAPEKSRLDDLIHALQDKHIDLKRVTQAIKATGSQIVDSIDAYLQEELFHGRTATRVKEFIDKELDPLIKLMRVNGVKMADFEEYLWARHAEERNIQIAKINPAMPDGGSGMSTKDARDYLKNLDPKTKSLYEALTKRVDAINKKSRQVLVDYGLESQKTINTWEAAYQHYVPLMREDMDHAFGNGTGQGFSVKGNAAKRATGSKRPVVDILANIAQQREKNIIRGEKNRVATALVGLAKTNPNPDFWKVDTPPTIRAVNKATGLVEDRIDPNYKKRDNVIVARIPDRNGNIQERSVIFNEHDPRALRMAMSLKNLDQDQIGALLGVSAKITRYFASINTQYNPVFGVVNLVRDFQASLLNLSSTQIAGHKTEVIKNVIPAIQAIYSASRAETKGKPKAQSPMIDLWDDLRQQGGMTGYRDLFKTSADRAEAIKRMLDPEAWMDSKLGKIFTAGGALRVPLSAAQKSAGWLLDLISDYNQTLEGAMRLSVYKVALDNGVSKPQAASISKTISVNFNRHGTIGRQAGALYAFFNASVQGTARLAETVKGPAGKRIVAGGILLGGMQAMLLAMAGMDDDEPPEFVKSKSLIIPIGNGKYLSVPMPLGFNVLPNLGRITTDFVMSGFKDPGKRTIQMMDSILDAFNPVGNAGMSLQTIAPTAIDPLAALAENKDWTGKPIARQDFNALNPTPGFTRAKDTASAFSKLLSEGLNTLSGGTKYQPGKFSPTPDQIDYLISQATGGVGREYLKAEQTITSKFTGEDLPPHKVPLLGRFYGDTKQAASQEAPFYENIKRLNGIEAEIKGRMKNREDAEDFKREHPEWTLIGTANTTEKMVQELRKRSRDLDKTDKPDKAELKKQFLERRREIMTRFNENYKAATAN